METKNNLKGAKLWKYEKTDSSWYMILEDTNTYSWTCSTNGLFNEEEELKIAKLIAAAPELLTALTELTKQLENEHLSEFCDEPIKNAINVINKATN